MRTEQSTKDPKLKGSSVGIRVGSDVGYGVGSNDGSGVLVG